MTALSSFVGSLVPVARAAAIEKLFGQGAGLAEMWASICSTLGFCNLGQAAPVYFYARIVEFLFLMTGGVAVIMVIYAGIKMQLSQGDESGLEEAKKVLMYALGGVVLSIAGYGIVRYIYVLLVAGSA